MSSVDQQLISVTRTAYGAYLQTCLKLGLPFNLIPNTTLNERLGIEAGVAPQASQTPTIKVMVFGNRGHVSVTASDGSSEILPVPHKAHHAGLYGLIPIVLRETDNDLPAEQRALYALSRIEQHNGRNYIAYYGLRLNYGGVQPTLQITRIIDGEEDVQPFVPDSADLNPTVPNIPNTGVIVGSNELVSSNAIISIRLSQMIVNEMTEAHRIRTGTSRSPILSEFGLASCVDRSVQSVSGGGYMFNEAIACQLNVIISSHHAIAYSNTGATLTFDVGNTEPLLALNNINTAPLP